MHDVTFPEPGSPWASTLATGPPVSVISRYADAGRVLMAPRFHRCSLYDKDAPRLLRRTESAGLDHWTVGTSAARNVAASVCIGLVAPGTRQANDKTPKYRNKRRSVL
jgi:hypothetical protein